MAGARDYLEGGHLFRIGLTGNRRAVESDDPRLADGVADNANKLQIGESREPAVLQQLRRRQRHPHGPDGSLYLVSLSHGVVYEIHRR